MCMYHDAIRWYNAVSGIVTQVIYYNDTIMMYQYSFQMIHPRKSCHDTIMIFMDGCINDVSMLIHHDSIIVILSLITCVTMPDTALYHIKPRYTCYITIMFTKFLVV